MLSTEIEVAIVIFIAILAIYSAWSAYRAAIHAQECASWMEKNNKAAVSLKKIAELEIAVTEQTDAIAAYGESLKKLRSRVGMRKVREERSNGSDMPDPATDPDGWKRAMRLKLHMDQRK